jgi:hypothetical protein
MTEPQDENLEQRPRCGIGIRYHDGRHVISFVRARLNIAW